MKRSLPIFLFYTIGMVVGFVLCAVGSGLSSKAHAAQPPQVATVTVTATPTLQNPPQSITCWIGDDVWVFQHWEPTQPTRIPFPSGTPTPLTEGTNTPTLRPSATATPTVGACRLYTVTATQLRVRSGPGQSFSTLRFLVKGETVSLSTKPEDSVTDADKTVWRRLCAEAGYLSQNWVSVK